MLSAEFDSGAWMHVWKQPTKSFGPKSVPLPGIATLVFNVGEDTTGLLVTRVRDIQAEGITIAAFDKYLASPGSKSFMRSSCVVVTLPAGHVACVPNGSIVRSIYHSMTDETSAKSKRHSKKSKDEAAAKYASHVFVPLLVEAWKVAEVPDVNKAFHNELESYCKTKSQRRVEEAQILRRRIPLQC